MRLFFVSYFKDGFRRWTQFRTTASEQQLRETIAQCYPGWEIEYINEW